MTIITFVSRYNGAGKSHAQANVVSEARGLGFDVGWTRLTRALEKAREAFIKRYMFGHKDNVIPDIGVSPRQIGDAIANALSNIHPDLPIWDAKNDVEEQVGGGWHVIIDDVRREREFIWLDKLAEQHGTRHHIIEIKPIGRLLDTVRLDTWTNGIEPCGYSAWEDRDYITVENDGTARFDEVVVDLVQLLIKRESTLIGSSTYE